MSNPTYATPCLDCRTTIPGRRTRALCTACYARNLHACTLDRFPKLLITEPPKLCGWCGVRTKDEHKECKDCRRIQGEPVADVVALTGGGWVSCAGGILRWVAEAA